MTWVTRAKNWFAEHPVGISFVGLSFLLTGALTLWQFFSKDPPIPRIIGAIRAAGFMPSPLQLIALMSLLVGIGLQIAVLIAVLSRRPGLKVRRRGDRFSQSEIKELERRCREVEQRYRELEQRGWVSKDIIYESLRLPPRQMGEPPRIKVLIRSQVEIGAPIRLRVWFSEPVTTPLVQFKPSPDDERYVSTSPRFIAADEAVVHEDGRVVDICWKSSGLDREVLLGDSKIQLVACATSDNDFPEVLDIQRRFFLS